MFRGAVRTATAAAMIALALLVAGSVPAAKKPALTPDQQHFRTGWRFLEKDDPAQADAAFARVSDSSPLFDLAAYQRIRIAFRAEEYGHALALADSVLPRLAQDGLAFRVRMHRALALVQLGRASEAVAEYESIRADHPDRQADQQLLRLGSAYEAAGRFQDAERAWQRLAFLHPKSAHRAVALENLAAMRKARGLAETPPAAEDLLAAIAAHRAAKRPVEAGGYARDFLRLYPDDPRAAGVRLDLAEFLIARGDLDGARAELSAAQAPREGREDWLARRDLLLARTVGSPSGERAVEAREALLAVAEHHPRSPFAADALSAIGHAYWDERAFERAAPFFATAYRLDPNDEEGPHRGWLAGWGYYLAGEQGKAAEILDTLAGRLPPGDDHARTLYWAGRAHQELGHGAAAAWLFEAVLTRYALDYYAFCAEVRLAEIGGRVPHGSAGRPWVEARLSRVPTGSGAVLDADLSADGALAALGRELPMARAGVLRLSALLPLEIEELADDEIDELVAAAEGNPAALRAVAVLYRLIGRELDAVRAANALFELQQRGRVADPAGTVTTLRMPFAYWEPIKRHAREQGFDPQFLMAVVRQESAFDPDARSAADARGLMQVIPGTGQRIARELGIKHYRETDLHDPDLSLRFGTYYLAKIRDRFAGDIVAALAGYNAGPGRPARWWPRVAGRPYDEAIERIPFRETRGYVKSILRNYEIYRHWYADAPGAPRPTGSAFAFIVRPVPPVAGGS